MTNPSDRVLAPAELHGLSRRANLPGAIRLGVHAALLGGSGWWLAVAGPWTIVPAFFAFGLTQVALFAPAHEMMHQTAFASRRANAIFGWLAACPSLLNLQFYTSFHLVHHRNTQVPARIRSWTWRDQHPCALVVRVLGLPYWRLRLRVIRDCWRGDLSAYKYISPKAAPGVIGSVRAMSVVMAGGAIASGLLFGWRTPLLFWIGPQLVCQPFLRAYVLAEHTGCTEDRNGLTNTRTTLTNAACGCDVEHAVPRRPPSVSVDPVPPAGGRDALLQTWLGFVQRGYVRWHAALLRQLRWRSARRALRAPPLNLHRARPQAPEKRSPGLSQTCACGRCNRMAWGEAGGCGGYANRGEHASKAYIARSNLVDVDRLLRCGRRPHRPFRLGMRSVGAADPARAFLPLSGWLSFA